MELVRKRIVFYQINQTIKVKKRVAVNAYEKTMIKYRLDFAEKYLNDAMELFNKKRFNSSASRAYYASYQAMWAALGDPEEGSLETSCNNKTFCKGLLVCTESLKNRAGPIGR